MKKQIITPECYEEIREINDVRDECVAENRVTVRDRFLLSLFYESGAHINEILSLHHSDLKPTNDGEVDIHFFGKGNKYRITPLLKEMMETIQRLL